MEIEHLKIFHKWMDEYEQLGLGFAEIPGRPDWFKVYYRTATYPPYKMEINLSRSCGHVESGGDYESNHGGSTTYGTMWDESPDERDRSEMPFMDWVAHYLQRMSEAIRTKGKRCAFVSGTH